MYFKITCPHCEKSLKVREELAGRKCACPYCRGSVRIPKQPEPPQEESTGPGFPNLDLNVAPKAKGRGGKPLAGKGAAQPKPKSEAKSGGASAGAWTDSSNVSPIQSGLIGAGASVVFLLLLLPFHKTMLGQLFWHRGWVPFVLTLLLFWSLAILGLKWTKLKRQRESMLLDVLPTELSKEITLDSLDKFEENLHGLPGEPGESFLINRVIRGLEHFRVRRNAAETVTMMESQSAIDANTVASSYAILKVFIWALPIMGFIGTVIGVSAAVASLGGSLESASDISVVKESEVSILPGGSGLGFDPVFVECASGSIVLHNVDPPQRIRRADMAAEEAFIELLDQVAESEKQRVVFLVRDDGLGTYNAARSLADAHDARRGKLPVIGQGRLDLSYFKRASGR